MCLASAGLVFFFHRTCASLRLGKSEHLGYKDFLWGGEYGNCFRPDHVKHQRKGEGHLVTDLLRQSCGRLLIAAKTFALLCQPQHQKSLSVLLNLSQKKTLKD